MLMSIWGAERSVRDWNFPVLGRLCRSRACSVLPVALYRRVVRSWQALGALTFGCGDSFLSCLAFELPFGGFDIYCGLRPCV